MQERSRGPKRFELGDRVDRPTLASIYHEEQTPAHWPPPTEANTRRAQTQTQRQQRAPRHGLIASQLGLPMRSLQSRASAQEPYAPDNWQTQAAADGDWPLEPYAASETPAAYGGTGEYAAHQPYAPADPRYYDEDSELQAAIDRDNSQGLYDEQLGAYYGAKNPPLDLRLPPVVRSDDDSYRARDYAEFAQAYAAPVEAPQPNTQRAHTQSTQTGTYPYTRQALQPSAAKWQTHQPIQRAASTNAPAPNMARAPHSVAANPYTPAPAPRARAANAQPQTSRTNQAPAQPRATTTAPRQVATTTARPRTAPAQLNRSAPAQLPRRAAHTFVDDEPVTYPKSRGSGWLKSLAFALCLAAGAYAARDLINPPPQPKQLTAPPVPAAAPAIPEPPAPIVEPAAPPVIQAAPVPQETAKARRSAARAAAIAERWHERRAARRARNDIEDATDQPDDTTEVAPAAHKTVRAAAQSGTLRINSRPWSQVYIDGQPIGHTPQMNLQLPAGQHQVTLINNEMQLRKTLNVNITPDNITTQTVNLAE